MHSTKKSKRDVYVIVDMDDNTITVEEGCSGSSDYRTLGEYEIETDDNELFIRLEDGFQIAKESQEELEIAVYQWFKNGILV